MEKIYGYKESDITGLIACLEQNQKLPLSKVFEVYANQSGKSKGTVRNLYYALAKASRQDDEFCQKYLKGKSLSVNQIVEFSSDEEQSLIDRVLLEHAQGKSVRSIILDMANGDSRLALRYQNKYRNALKNKPNSISVAVERLRSAGNDVSFLLNKKPTQIVSDSQIGVLKKEINDLFDRVSIKLKCENQRLKDRIVALENENIRLRRFIYGGLPQDTINYFGGGGKDMIN